MGVQLMTDCNVCVDKQFKINSQKPLDNGNRKYIEGEWSYSQSRKGFLFEHNSSA